MTRRLSVTLPDRRHLTVVVDKEKGIAAVAHPTRECGLELHKSCPDRTLCVCACHFP